MRNWLNGIFVIPSEETKAKREQEQKNEGEGESEENGIEYEQGRVNRRLASPKKRIATSITWHCESAIIGNKMRLILMPHRLNSNFENFGACVAV